MRQAEDNEQPNEDESSFPPRPKAPPIGAWETNASANDPPAVQPVSTAWADAAHLPGIERIPDDTPTLGQGGHRGAAFTRFSGTGVATRPLVERQERRAMATTIGLVVIAIAIFVVVLTINFSRDAHASPPKVGSLGQTMAHTPTPEGIAGTLPPGSSGTTGPGPISGTIIPGSGATTPTTGGVGQATGTPAPAPTSTPAPTSIAQPTATVASPPTATAVPGPCASGWSDFWVTDGNLIDSNTNTATVIQIQYDSNGHWCGPERVEHVLRIGANDPGQNLSGQFLIYGNGPGQSPTSSNTDVNQNLAGTNQVQYFTYDSATWTWQYCVEAITASHDPSSGQTSTADTGDHCI